MIKLWRYFPLRIRKFFSRLLWPVVLLGTWQAVSPLSSRFAIPGPWEIFRQCILDAPLLSLHLWPTLQSALIGLVCGTAVGLILGWSLQRSTILTALFYGPALFLF